MKSLNSFFIEGFVSAILDALPPSAQLLDLGCGEQPYRKYYEHNTQTSITADYFIRSQIDVQADAKNLPFPDNSFDCVLLSEVIEHIPEPGIVIQEISRILDSRGYLILTWPFNYSMHEVPHDYTRFTEFGMARVLVEHQLDVVMLQRRGDLFAVQIVLATSLLANLITVARRSSIGKYVETGLSVAEHLLQFLHGVYYRSTRNSARLNPRKPGLALAGFANHAAHWTLGYCVLAQKR